MKLKMLFSVLICISLMNMEYGFSYADLDNIHSKQSSKSANISSVEQKDNTMSFSSKETTAKDVTVTVTAAKGVLPKGTITKVKDISKKQVKNIIKESVSNVKDLIAVDISFYYKGKEIEPNGNVSVYINTGKKVAGNNHKVVHLMDNNAVEEVGSSAANSAKFVSDSFSIYAIVGVGDKIIDDSKPKEKPTREYKFYVKDKLVNTQILKNGERLIEPSIPQSDDGAFNYWFKENGTKFSKFGIINDIRKKEIVKLNAKFTRQSAITFYNVDNEKVAIKVGKNGEKIRTDDVYVELLLGQYISKWCKSPDGSSPVGKEIIIGNNDISLYPMVKGGHWLFFNGNEKDGNAMNGHISPQFIKALDKQKEITPKRNGYEFAGWYEDKNCTKKFDFNRTINRNKEIFAKWIPKQSSYILKIHQQKCIDGKYTPNNYVLTDKKVVKALSDSNITKAEAEKEATKYVNELIKNGNMASYNNYYYFDFNSKKTKIQNNKVRGDGTSVVNIYYDLHPYTIKFFKKNKAAHSLALNENKYTSQMFVNGKPYDGDYYLVKNYHLGEYINNKAPDIKVYPKDNENTNVKRVGWIINNSGQGINYNIWYLDNDFDLIQPRYLVRENVKGFETINCYPAFTDKLSKYKEFCYFETQEKGIYKERIDIYDGIGIPNAVIAFSKGFKSLNPKKIYNKTIKVKRKDGKIENVTIPDGNTQRANLTYYNIYNRQSYELTFFNKSAIEKSYSGNDSILYNANIENKIYTPKKPLDLNEYYTFKGWANKMGELYNAEKLKNMPYYNLYLYAQWEIKKVNVTFDSNGGTAIKSQVINAGEKVAKPKPPTNNDKNLVFAGWVLPDGLPFNFNQNLTKDTKLIARWIDKTSIVIRYDAKDGRKAPIDKHKYMDISYARILGAPKQLPKNKFFKGWDLNGKIYHPGQFCMLKSELAKRLKNGDYEIVLNAIYSEGTEKTKIIYNSNFAKNIKIERGYINNSAITIPTIEKLKIKRDGYVFIGWNTKKDGGGTSYDIGDEIRIDNDTPLPNELFAQWHKLNKNSRNSKSHNQYNASKSPATGDENSLLIYSAILILSVSLMIIMCYMNRRKITD